MCAGVFFSFLSVEEGERRLSQNTSCWLWIALDVLLYSWIVIDLWLRSEQGCAVRIAARKDVLFRPYVRSETEKIMYDNLRFTSRKKSCAAHINREKCVLRHCGANFMNFNSNFVLSLSLP